MKINNTIIGLGIATLLGVVITSTSTIKAVKAAKIIKTEREELDKIIEEVHDAGREDIYSEEMYKRDLMTSENKTLAKTIIEYSIPTAFGLVTGLTGYKLIKEMRC